MYTSHCLTLHARLTTWCHHQSVVCLWHLEKIKHTTLGTWFAVRAYLQCSQDALMHAMQTLLLGYVSEVTSRLRARLRPCKCRIAQYTRANLTRAAVHGTPQSCRMRATYSRATGAGDPHCVCTLHHTVCVHSKCQRHTDDTKYCV